MLISQSLVFHKVVVQNVYVIETISKRRQKVFLAQSKNNQRSDL